VQVSNKSATLDEKKILVQSCLDELARGKAEQDVIFFLGQLKTQLAEKYATGD
jgi:hypothetical protein